MTLLTNTSAASQIVAAMNSGDQNEMVQAWEVFGEEVAENIRRDFEQFRETKDDSVLAQRGYRVLTSAEQAWYTKVSAALKSSKTKQAFIDILKSDDKDDLMPETIIDDVLRYLVETRPLLSKIRFRTPVSPRSGSSTTTPCSAAAGARSMPRLSKKSRAA